MTEVAPRLRSRIVQPAAASFSAGASVRQIWPAPCDLPVDEGGYHGVALGGACREIDIAVDTVDSRAVTLDGLEFVVAGDADDETVGCRSQVDGAGQFIEADVRHHSRFVLPQPVAGGFGSRLRGEGKGRVFVNLAAQQRFRGVFADDRVITLPSSATKSIV